MISVHQIERGLAVRDDEEGALAEALPQRGHQPPLGLRVERRGELVEDHLPNKEGGTPK